jgi:lipid biosynthesis B12-binding/radical SAM protein
LSRILLVSSNTSSEPYPVYPLGMSVLASAMADRGHKVAQFDFLARGASEQALRREIAEFAPDFIGISIRNVDNVDSFSSEHAWYLPTNKRMVEILREETDRPVILGGSGYSLLPEAMLEYLGADYGIVGEGEQALARLLSGLESGTASPPILSASECPLEGAAIPSAAWDAQMVGYYGADSVMGVQTKRGCPHRCAYCTYPSLEGGELRCREPGAVVDEMEHLRAAHGVDRFFFTDSVFNDEGGHYLSVAEEIARRDLGVHWSAFFRPEIVEPSALSILKRAGLESIEIGTDAASDQTLAGLAKPFLFDEVLAFQEACRKERIPAAHYVVFGGPEETEASLKEGIANMERLRECVVFGFSGIRLFPGTGLYERALAEGCLTREENLLKPFYYFSPHVDRSWMEQTVKQGFRGRRDRIFPPGDGQMKLKVLHRFGYRGPLWDRLISFP